MIEDSFLDEIKPPRHGGRVEEIARERGISPGKIIDFSANTNPLAPPENLGSYLADSASSLELYPDDSYGRFRNAVIDFLGNESGAKLERKNVIPGNGSVEIFRLFIRAIATAGAGTVLVPFPTFSEYALQSRLFGLEVDRKKYRELFGLDEAILSVYDAVFICNPNNPTGTLRDKETLVKFLEKARAAETFLVLDEAFNELSSPGESLVGFVNRFPNLIIVRSLTKAFTVPGLRIGYGVASGKLAGRMEKLRPPWNLNYLAASTGRRFLEEEKGLLKRSREYLEGEREWLREKLEDLGFSVYPSSTNYLLFRTKETGLKAAEIVDRCLDYNVLVRNADSFYGIDQWHVRVAVKKREDNEKLVRALGEAIA